MFDYSKDLLAKKAKNIPFLYAILKRFYVRLMRSKDPRLFARYYFIRKLNDLVEFMLKHEMTGGIIDDKGKFYLKMNDGLYLYYNYQDSNCTIGDGQSLDFKSARIIHPLETFLMNNLDSDSVYIDVGANNGYYYTLKVARAFPRAKVYAFEPDRKILGHLKKNIEFNGLNNIVVVTQALSNYVGKADITADLEASNFLVVNSATGYRTSTIDCNTLDNFLTSNNLDRLSCIKVDIEGGEYNFLQGARQSILNFRPILVLEVNDQLLKRSNSSREEVISFMRNLSYRGFSINKSFDVLFIPEERCVTHILNEYDWIKEMENV